MNVWSKRFDFCCQAFTVFLYKKENLKGGAAKYSSVDCRGFGFVLSRLPKAKCFPQLVKISVSFSARSISHQSLHKYCSSLSNILSLDDDELEIGSQRRQSSGCPSMSPIAAFLPEKFVTPLEKRLGWRGGQGGVFKGSIREAKKLAWETLLHCLFVLRWLWGAEECELAPCSCCKYRSARKIEDGCS